MDERAPEDMPELPATQDGEPYVPVELYRSAMVRKWGLLYHLFGFSLVFRALRLTGQSAERVRQASSRGPVVYVMRTRSHIDYLALNEVLRRRRLPLAHYGTGISMTAFMPVFEALGLLKDKLLWFFRNGRLPNPVDVGWLTRLVGAGRHAAVFLRQAPDWKDFFEPSKWPDAVAALLEAQTRCDRPVQLVPVVVIWQREPERARKGTMKALLGSEEDQGTLLKLWGVARGLRRAVVQVGEPVDLQTYVERYAEEPTEQKVRRLRRVLRRYLFREQHIVRGPRLKSPAWTRRLVLDSARVRKLVEQEAVHQQRPVPSIQHEVLKTYDAMAARFSYAWVGLGEVVTNFLWRTMYQGIDVRPEDIEKIRAATREGSAVLCPSHRSHLDYVLMTSVLHDNDVVIPHVIAGDNLSFFPLGPLFRRFGAVFIKRSFRGERIFPTLFQAYLTHLFREGYIVEFFLEGGRSRTGKVLPAKLGILGYTMDAGVEARLGRSAGEVSWLPINITYEQVAEEGPYARELAGKDKEKETVGGLFRAVRMVFKQYGRVYIRVGDPVLMTDVVSTLETPWPELDRGQRGEVLHAMGEEILYAINQQTVILPTGLVAAALLAQARPGVPGDVLDQRIARFRSLLLDAGAELAVSLVDGDHARNEALARFRRERSVQELHGPDGIVYSPVADKRVTLEYYKNALLHYLIPGSYVGAAIRALNDDVIDIDRVRGLVRFQLFLLRYEFVNDPQQGERAFVDAGLAQLERIDALVPHGDGGWRVDNRARVSELAELTANFLESYYLVLRAAHQLASADLDDEGVVSEIQKLGRQFLAVQDIRRPEALSAVNLRNALKAWREDGVLVARAGGGVELDRDAARIYVDQLRVLMRMADPADEARLHG